MGKLYSKKKQSLGCQKISLVYIFADQGYFLFMFQFATPIIQKPKMVKNEIVRTLSAL